MKKLVFLFLIFFARGVVAFQIEQECEFIKWSNLQKKNIEMPNESFLELVHLCEGDDFSNGYSGFGQVQTKGGFSYRVLYRTYDKANTPVPIGLAFSRYREDDIKGYDYSNFRLIMTRTEQDKLLKLYGNGFDKMLYCLSRFDCSKELFEDVGVFKKLFDSSYKNFINGVAEAESCSRWADRVTSLEYSGDEINLEFISAKGEIWALAFNVDDSGLMALKNVRGPASEKSRVKC